MAYHTSCRTNFEAIRTSGTLESAEALLRGTSHEHLLSQRRATSSIVQVNGRAVRVRDNRPLAPGSLALPDGWSLSDWLQELNSWAFMWPGGESGPIARGKAHFARYAAEGDVFTIRVRLRSVIEANGDGQLFVTRCNSGSARHHGGQPVSRGLQTFSAPEAAGFRPSDVVELAYRGRIHLPDEAMWSQSLGGPWHDLRNAA